MDEQTRKEIVENLKKIGYLYVTLDLAGYRTGSMNEPILEDSSSSTKKSDNQSR
jgi:uncharacterized protein